MIDIIEAQCLNYILEKKNMSFIIYNNLDETYFPTFLEEYRFIKNHYDKYGNVPDKETIIQEFPDFQFIQVNESDQYLAKEIREAYLYRALVPDVNKIVDLMTNNKTDQALECMIKASSKINLKSTIEPVDLINQAQLRYDKYVEKCNDPARAYVTTGLKELDEILGGWDRQEEFAVISAKTNQGKCLEKGTLVLMADGTKKKIEDIKLGDKVQSINSVNTVFELHSGKAKGYKIIPKVGEPFVISADHILTLVEKYFEQKNNKRVYKQRLIDISIEDYLKSSNHFKKKCFLYKPEINYSNKNLSIPPYVLGLWLGDGCKDRPELCTADIELANIWKNYANSLNLQVKQYHFKNSKAYSYSITSGSSTGPTTRNSFKELLKSYNLIGNKHIPLDYLTSSKIQRLELLAGIIDTDGYYTGDRFGISTKLDILADNYYQLISSLGFKVSKRIMYIKVGKERRPYYEISFSGDLTQIPTILSRKKVTKYSPRDSLTTRFDIEELNEIEYYGFACDGDHRFILGNGFVTHNSWWLLYFALHAAIKGLKVGIYSGEMEPDKLGYRIDTFLFNISNWSITHGDINVQVQYKESIDKIKDLVQNSILVVTPEMLEGNATVSKLRAFIERSNLDLLCIDQYSLMEDERRGKQGHEAFANIAKDLKRLQTMKHIPILAVAQLNREENENGITIENIAGSYDIMRYATTALLLEQKDKDDQKIKRLVLTVGKARDAKVGSKLTYMWDINYGKLTFVPTENDATNGSHIEDLKEEFGDIEENIF